MPAMEEIRGPTMEDLHRWKGRQGPKLRGLLGAQEGQHPPVRCAPSLLATIGALLEPQMKAPKFEFLIPNSGYLGLQK